MKMESMDIVAKNIDKIAELFPSCITEKVDDKGNLKKAVNFDILKEILSEKSGGDTAEYKYNERYEFTWVGKMLQEWKQIRLQIRLYVHV